MANSREEYAYRFGISAVAAFGLTGYGLCPEKSSLFYVESRPVYLYARAKILAYNYNKDRITGNPLPDLLIGGYCKHRGLFAQEDIP